MCIIIGGSCLVNYIGVGNGLFDIWQCLYYVIDFVQFDMLFVNFQLIIIVFEVFYCVVIQLVGNVFGMVYLFIWGKRIGNKAVGGQIGVFEIVLCQLNVSEIEIICYIWWYWMYYCIKNMQICILYWIINWYIAVVYLCQFFVKSWILVDIYCCFCWVIQIM